jgi:hypothetical protein
MAKELGIIIADFQTSLAGKIAIGDVSGTLLSATDDDGVILPDGRYFFTIDSDNSSKEHISCDLVGTTKAITNIKTVARGTGVETVGTLREHRIGATVTITDFAHIKKINDLLDGTTDLDADNPLKYDADPTLTDAKELATKKYVDERRVITDTSTATLTPNADEYNEFILTAQAESLTIANVSGTLTEGQLIIIRIKDDGSEQLITWGTDYRIIGTTLPTVTVANKTIYVAGLWNDTDSKVDILSVNIEE